MISHQPLENIDTGDRILLGHEWRTVEQIGNHEQQGHPDVGWIAGSYEPQEEGTTWHITVFPNERMLVDKTEPT